LQPPESHTVAERSGSSAQQTTAIAIVLPIRAVHIRADQEPAVHSSALPDAMPAAVHAIRLRGSDRRAGSVIDQMPGDAGAATSTRTRSIRLNAALSQPAGNL